MTRKYIIVADDSLKGFDEEIAKLEREWGAEEIEPCDDCISRQAVEEITWEEPSYTDALNALTEVRDKIRQLQPVTRQPKKGRWIIIDDCEQFIAKCSECGRIEDSRMISKYPYCHCGTRMEVEE